MKLRKLLAFLFMGAVLAGGFCSCGDDDDDATGSGTGSQTTQLKDNQVSVGGHGVYDFQDVSLGITRSGVNWDGETVPEKYHMMFFSDETAKYHLDLIMDFTADLVGKTIKFENPSVVTDNNSFNFTFTIDPMDQNQAAASSFRGGLRYGAYKGKSDDNNYAYEDNGKEDSGKIKSGTCTVTKVTGGTRVVMSANLSNGSVVAFNGFVSDKDTRYYDYK